MSAQTKLARLVLEMLTQGQPVPINDALQLRNWAVVPEDVILPLEEIARRIVTQEENSNVNTAEQG
jgi:hypothetical protein